MNSLSQAHSMLNFSKTTSTFHAKQAKSIRPKADKRPCARPGCKNHARGVWHFCYPDSMKLPAELKAQLYRAGGLPVDKREAAIKDAIRDCNEYFRQQATERIEESRR